MNTTLSSQPSLLTSSSPENWLGIFSLTPKYKLLLSVDDRRIEGSEEERDTPELRKLKKDYIPADAPTNENEVMNDATSSSSSSNDIRLPVEYLKPSEYEKKRAEFFV